MRDQSTNNRDNIITECSTIKIQLTRNQLAFAFESQISNFIVIECKIVYA